MPPTTAIPTRLPEPDRDRWTVLRAGIQNVWEYDDREFVFNRGRLLLRGQNEAGKTKAMELLFPFLLDADLAPQRLDPFGTTSRPMRWNLINESDPEAQLRIGYLWLELGRLQAGRATYCTIGAGVKARRASSDVDAWFFVTSQRPGADVRFVVADRPLAKGELVEAIGTSGQVFDRHGDYRRAVNARLFAMPEEQYAALVETLLHLRRPQLSKTLDLDQLSRFLSASLPPLDVRVVGPIAEGFERLDHHRADLEALEETLGKLRGFDQVYREYARAIAKGRAQELARAESAYQRARSETRERAAELEALLGRRTSLEEALTELGLRERMLAERIRALQDSDAYRAAKALDDEEQAARRAASAAEDAARRASEDESFLAAASARSAEAAREAKDRGDELERARVVAAARAKDAALDGVHGAVDALAGKGEAGGAAGALAAIRAQRDAVVSRLRDLAREHSRAAEAHRRAEERAAERAAALEAAREALREAERRCGEAEEAWVSAAEAWLGGLRVLRREELSYGSEDAPDPAAFRRAVESAAEPLRRSIAGLRAAAAARLDAVRADEAALREERDALARAPHPTPPAPSWRPSRSPDRPGAPLYVLCDFGPAAAGAEAAIEAALESSGLLDAWVEPDGTLLDPRTEDVILRGPSPAVRGRSLADVLVPVAAGGVSEERARTVLAAIGFAAAGETPDADAWIAADGRWRVGPLHGAWMKAATAYVGATARERERARRIADLEARLRALGETAAALEGEVRAAEERLDVLAHELGSVPAGAEVETARARVDFRAEAHADAHVKRLEAERAAKEAEAARAGAAALLDRAAAEAGVGAFARDPDQLAERSRAYFEAGEALVARVRDLGRALAAAERESKAAAGAGERAGRSREASARAAEEAAAAGARAAALRESSGKDRDEVLAALDAARGEERDARSEKDRAEGELRGLGERVGEARKAAEQAEGAVSDREDERKKAAAAFGALAPLGVLAASGFPVAEPASEWSFTASLELARKVDGAIEIGAKPEERERAEDRLMRRQTDLALQLPPEVRVVPSRTGEVLSYQFTWNGRTRPAAEVIGEMEADAAARIELLGEEERQLLERFLSGEAHDHLASRLREARALVDRMNSAIEGRTTAAGAQVRLDWSLDDSAQADAKDAVPLFLHAGRLLSEANRKALRAFLQRRLAQAREAGGDRSLQDRLLDVLDYRTWHRFQVEHRTPGQAWAKLTRKAHAAGSGGKKAVMLHLPLFAAAAAFYDSADPAAPRVIALDEVFAGIDRPTRGKLMGLLAEFDLDFIMTSYEEWGFYEELDGLSTYHLSREPGHRGVFAEWFVWNGRERVLMEEA